jgi:hypothetical protein
MKPYFFSVKVVLRKPLKATVEAGGHYGFLTGYYRNVGIRAEDLAQALKLLQTIAEDGEIDRKATVVHDFNRLEQKISSTFVEGASEVIWYVFGRIFFPPTVELS